MVHSYLFGGGPGRRRTCEQRCRRRKSRRTSPAHPAEAEWGSAPGCSSPDPTQDNECQSVFNVSSTENHHFPIVGKTWI